MGAELAFQTATHICRPTTSQQQAQQQQQQQ
jgi:hypothetical protein